MNKTGMDELTVGEREVLEGAALGPLHLWTVGWVENAPGRQAVHGPATIDALANRGLLEIEAAGGGRSMARITFEGRRALNAR